MQVLIGGIPVKRVGVDLLALAMNDRSAGARELRRCVLELRKEPGDVAMLYVRSSTARWIVASEIDVPHVIAPFEGGTLLARAMNRAWLRIRRSFDDLDVIEQLPMPIRRGRAPGRGAAPAGGGQLTS